MKFQVLSRVCRPQNFDQVIGQKAIVQSIRNSVVLNRVSHAYLFSGTRGVGKTSMARIFAKVLRCSDLLENGLACEKCDGCLEFSSKASLNFYEIDGASNNKVENIRDLISDLQTLPSFGKYKIIIIDEVHMLSISAFNALLKTLEEPPEHIVFIFATTEPWKLPDTIISRCLRYDFLSLSTENLTEYILKISQNYDFKFENKNVAMKIASLGKGSVRDTLSLLDQIRSFNSKSLITESDLADCLGVVKNDDIEKIVYFLLSGELSLFKKEYSTILLKNLNHKNFVIEVINKFYQIINLEEGDSLSNKLLFNFVQNDLYQDELFFIFETLVQDMKWAMESFDPIQSIEIVFQKICLRRELLESSSKKKNNLNKLELSSVNIFDNKDKSKEINNDIIDYNSWESFLIKLASLDNSISSKLERLYLDSFKVTDCLLSIRLSYDDKSEIFFKYFEGELENNKLKSYLLEYFKSDQLDLEFVMKKNHDNVKSLSQIKEERNNKLQEDKIERLKNEPIVLKAKEIFNATIDKVKLH